MGVEMGTAGRCVLVPVSGLAAGLCEAEACGEPSRSVCSFFRKSKRSLFERPTVHTTHPSLCVYDFCTRFKDTRWPAP